MKKLKLNQMENIEGGIKNRSCLLAGAIGGFTLTVGAVLFATGAAAGGAWAVFGGSTTVAGVIADCF